MNVCLSVSLSLCARLSVSVVEFVCTCVPVRAVLIVTLLCLFGNRNNNLSI